MDIDQFVREAQGSVVVKALCYKPKVVGSRPNELNAWVHSLLTEMNTRSRKIMCLGSKVRPVRMADNLAVICEPIV
jgi:hypothetical protein